MSHHLKELGIEKIVTGGYGLGHSPTGKVVLVQGAIAGELLDVQIFKSKKSYDIGFITAIKEPSPLRIEPLCKHAGECGGCSLQHLAYDEQIRVKKEVFLEDWQRYFKDTILPKIEFYPAPAPFNYRQRIRLHLDDGDHCFYRHHSNKSIPVESCLLAKESINTSLDELKSQPAYSDLQEHLTEIVLHDNPANNRCIIELFFKRKLRPADKKRINALLKLPTIQAVRAYGSSSELLLLAGDDPKLHFSMENRYGSLAFSLIPGDFCQINMAQNQAMLDYVMARIDHDKPKRILDLFCGLGNFSIPLAKLGHKLTGIELKRSSIRNAEINGEQNGVNCKFLRTSAEKGLVDLITDGKTYDIIILDPPRSGFKDGALLVHKLSAQKIFYIACDQQTQMRDIKMISACGYEVVEVCLVDMFPQTHHLESIVVLQAV